MQKRAVALVTCCTRKHLKKCTLTSFTYSFLSFKEEGELCEKDLREKRRNGLPGPTDTEDQKLDRLIPPAHFFLLFSERLKGLLLFHDTH